MAIAFYIPDQESLVRRAQKQQIILLALIILETLRWYTEKPEVATANLTRLRPQNYINKWRGPSD